MSEMMSYHEMPKSILKKKTSFDGGRSNSGHLQIHPILKRNSLGSEQLTTSLATSPPSPHRHIKLPHHDSQITTIEQQEIPIQAAHSQVHPILKKSSSEDDNYTNFYHDNQHHHNHRDEDDHYWHHQRSSSSGPKPCLKKRSSYDEMAEKKQMEIKPILKRKDTKSEPDFTLKSIIKPLSQSSLPTSTGTIITQEEIEADLLSRNNSRSPSRSWRCNT